MGLTVAVTGPTGEIGLAAVAALEAREDVDEILGMARRPFDAQSRGWTKTTYQRGDILDRDAVDRLVADADVVVHLAYLIMGSREQSRTVNLEGTRNVFEATVAAQRPTRLVYTSSVLAYGYHRDNPQPLTEDVPARGSAEHYYSEQKAECEDVLHEVTDGTELEVYVLRPCIVAGPEATKLSDEMPWRQLSAALPEPFGRIAAALQNVLPLLPDPGVALQLVHHDDVASAIALAATGAGSPGNYNLAGDGEITFAEVARATGTRSVRVPHAAARVAAAAVAHLPLVPAAAEWINLGSVPVVMDCSRAKDVLGWDPEYSSAETLAAMVRG